MDTYDCCIFNNPGVPGACGGFTGPKPFELPKFDPKSLLNPVKKFVNDVCKIVAMSSVLKIECTETAVLDEINKCFLRADAANCLVAVCDYAKENCWSSGLPHEIDKYCL